MIACTVHTFGFLVSLTSACIELQFVFVCISIQTLTQALGCMTWIRNYAFLKTFIRTMGRDPKWILALLLLGFHMTRGVIINFFPPKNKSQSSRLHFFLSAQPQKVGKSFFLAWA